MAPPLEGITPPNPKRRLDFDGDGGPATKAAKAEELGQHSAIKHNPTLHPSAMVKRIAPPPTPRALACCTLHSLPFNAKPHRTQEQTLAGLEDVMEALGVCSDDLKDIEAQLGKKFKDMGEAKTEVTNLCLSTVQFKQLQFCMFGQGYACLLDVHTIKHSGTTQASAATPASSYEQQLQAALKCGQFDIRGPLGQKFGHAHKKGTPGGALYMMRKTNKDKAEFRQAWANTEYTTMIQKKIHIKSYQVVNASMGTYKPFAVLVKDEGGKDDPECLQAAKKIAAKCVALGGPWVNWNVMSERLEFLHLRKEYNEIMQDSWQQYLEEKDETARPQDLEGRCAKAKPEGKQEPILMCAYVACHLSKHIYIYIHTSIYIYIYIYIYDLNM